MRFVVQSPCLVTNMLTYAALERILTMVHGIRVRWSRLARSTGPNWIGFTPLHPPEDGDRASLRNVVIYRKNRTMDIVHKHSSLVKEKSSDWLRAGRPRSRSLSPGKGNFCIYSTLSRRFWIPHKTAIHWVVYPEVYRPRPDDGNALLNSTEITHTRIYTPIPQCALNS
jgi:hypothetical protein